MPDQKPTTAGTRRITTASQLRALKPESRAYEVGDTKTKGLRLRVQPSGAMGWWFVYREPGTREAPGKIHRIRLGTHPPMGLEAARKAREAWAAERNADGRDDPHEQIATKAREKREQAAQAAAEAKRGVWTVKRLADAWIEASQHTTRPRTWGEAKRQIAAYVEPTIGDLPAESVTPEDIEKVLRPIERRGKVRQRNAVRTTCVMLWNWASSVRGPSHLRKCANPAAEVDPLRAKPARGRRAFTEGELRALWGRLTAERGNPHADALALTLLCGTRTSETVGARWAEIDLDAGTWQIPAARTKSGRAHLVYLSPQAVALLTARKRSRGFVFAHPGTAAGHVRADALPKALRAHVNALKLDASMTPHELRHSLLTAVVGRFRMGQEVRRRVANHTTGDKLEDIYVHVSWDEEAREAWARWGTYLDGLVSGSKVIELRPGVER